MRVAPWLAEPADLEEAYGVKRKPREIRPDGSHAAHKPPQQPAFRQRVRSMSPYRDIVEQVEQNCHGKGGVRRSHVQAANERKKEQRKKPEPTPTERAADSLATSRCGRYAKGLLSRPESWPDPEPMYPEVAFLGRSNVGKSSLLNKVSRFGTVAAVSDMPGRTKHVSWFRNRKVRLDVIDMPGYGHADRAQVFGPAAMEFVKQRTSLRVLYVLIDARHGFKRTDHEWLKELGGDGPMKQIVLTKCDLVAPRRLIKIASLARSDLEAFRRVNHRLLLCSAKTEAGVHDLRIDICRRCGRPRDSGGTDEATLFSHSAGSRMPPPVHTHHQRGGGSVGIDEVLDVSHLAPGREAPPQQRPPPVATHNHRGNGEEELDPAMQFADLDLETLRPLKRAPFRNRRRRRP
mmetsp:Transcript_116757/g.341834  ORF Transcript_116757/g.341834 Transcript_116757/m.341834 type:complete len:404 (+) Transcript_116757:74-1285(+)